MNYLPTRFTLDDDRHLTVYSGRRIVWQGSPEAFAAESEHQAPPSLILEIELAVENHDAAEEARDERGFNSRA